MPSDNASWAAQKLGLTNSNPMPQLQRLQPRPQVQQATHVSPDGLWEWNGRDWVPRQQDIPPPPPPQSYAPDPRLLAKTDGRCPQCDSGNYMSSMQTETSGPHVGGKSASRCFDCGYTSGRNFAQTSSFDKTPTVHGQAAPGVKQVAVNGFHPDVYVNKQPPALPPPPPAPPR